MSKKSAGKNSTSNFVPNFHGMLNDLTTIGVQRVTGSSPLGDNFFFLQFFMIINIIPSALYGYLMGVVGSRNSKMVEK